ncbi:hypothetical protein ACFU7D_00030 [Nocardioides sp. NPDC057577]|uniref:hypothetical protein n=1 Tax=Nocardioides sp. NPDC057577 TaxID=3346171 RepID=UPI00366C1BAC
MSATDDPETTTADRPSRGRSIAAVICLVLAGLLMTPAAVAYWGQRTLNDAERYVETVGPLVESPEVQDVIATRVTAAIQKQVDVEAILNTAFAGVIADRPRLEQLVAPLAAAINGLVEREVRAFIASDEFADIWVLANTRAQQSLQRILNGDDSGAVSLQGDELVLDVDEVIERVKDRLVARGLTIVENVPIPETDRQIVLMDAPQLRQVRTIYAFSNPVAQWLLPVVGVLFLGALVLARRRPRMAVWIGAVIAANALLLAWVLSIGEQMFVNALAGTDFGPASRIFFDTLLTYLDRGQQVVLWLGLVIVVAGWFAGSNRYGTTARTTIGGGLENLGSRLGDGPVGAAGRWVAANVGWVRVVVVALGGVVLLWGNNVSMNRLWWSLALVVALLVVLQVLVGAGRPRETTASLGSGPATGPEPGPAI